MKTNEKITKELGFAILEAAGWEKVSLNKISWQRK